MTKRGSIFKKSRRKIFCVAEFNYTIYLLNQHRKLTNDRNVRGGNFPKVPSIK